jgi:hypothetical protein
MKDGVARKGAVGNASSRASSSARASARDRARVDDDVDDDDDRGAHGVLSRSRRVVARE